MASTNERSIPGSLRLIASFALLLLGACGGDNLLLPRDGEPAKIAPVNAENLVATVGQPLGDSLVALVTDPAGRPVPGVVVTFVPPDGASTQPAEPVTTDAGGRAAVQYVLSTTAGDQVVEARASIVPETNGVTSFHVAAQPESPESLAMAGGDAQTAQVSTVLPESLAVKAVDRFGNGVPGVEVTWQPTGGGDLTPRTDTTGADGRAAVARTLGDSPGSYGAVAKAEALGGPPVAFIATAIPAPKPVLALVTPPSVTAVAGVPLEQPPEIQLQDPTGAPLPREGVKVTVDVGGGEGSLGGGTSKASDANGRVAFTGLEFRGGTGTRTLIFSAPGFTPAISPEILVRPGEPSGARSSLSVSNGQAGQKTTITLRLKDDFDNDIAGASADLSIRINGANAGSDIAVTETSSGTYTGSYVPVHSGRDEVTIEFHGQELPGASAVSTVAPGPADPSTSTAQVTKNGVFFVQVDVVVTTRDAQGNPLNHGGDEVEIIPNGGRPRTCAPVQQAQTCVDRENGTYVDRFIVLGNSISVAIRLNGNPLSGSPFTP
jgi:Filamin/ABP280 repeat